MIKIYKGIGEHSVTGEDIEVTVGVDLNAIMLVRQSSDHPSTRTVIYAKDIGIMPLDEPFEKVFKDWIDAKRTSFPWMVSQ